MVCGERDGEWPSLQRTVANAWGGALKIQIGYHDTLTHSFILSLLLDLSFRYAHVDVNLALLFLI